MLKNARVTLLVARALPGFMPLEERRTHLACVRLFMHNASDIIIPAHRPVKSSTLSHILKQAGLSVGQFLRLL